MSVLLQELKNSLLLILSDNYNQSQLQEKDSKLITSLSVDLFWPTNNYQTPSQVLFLDILFQLQLLVWLLLKMLCWTLQLMQLITKESFSQLEVWLSLTRDSLFSFLELFQLSELTTEVSYTTKVWLFSISLLTNTITMVYTWTKKEKLLIPPVSILTTIKDSNYQLSLLIPSYPTNVTLQCQMKEYIAILLQSNQNASINLQDILLSLNNPLNRNSKSLLLQD